MKTTGQLWLSFAFNIARAVQAFPALPLSLIHYLIAIEILHHVNFE